MKTPFLWIVSVVIMSQPAIAQQIDSILTYQAYLQLVMANHPIAKQIALKRTKADLELKRARAGFDPNLTAQWDRKQFDKKNYYNILNTHLNVPIWNGIGAEVGYNYNDGLYLNPENKLPSNGQMYLGLKASLLKGLWTDERRAEIDKAKVLIEASEVEINLALNDLLYDAAMAYWEWTQAYYSWDISRQSLDLIQEQLLFTVELYKQGALPAIDTLKAYVKLQDRQIYNGEVQLKLQQMSQQLSVFLWSDNDEPLQIDYTINRPIKLEDTPTPRLTEEFLKNTLAQLNIHPWLQYYEFKLNTLNIDRRLKQNKLLPKLDVKYNFLSTNDIDFFDNATTAATPIQNYKLGIKFSMPLFLRKERMELKLNQLKRQETNYQQQAKQQELSVKIQNYFAAVQAYADQVALTASIVDNYELLLEGEVTKFDNGESSLFLINTRETQLFNANQKLVKQAVSYFKSKTKLAWSTATLTQ